MAAHYDIALITPAEPTWERPFIVDWEGADPADQAALDEAGRALARRHELAGVVTWTEWYLVPVAHLAHRLALPTTAPEVMRDCRNKGAARHLFARHGVPSAASVSVSTLAGASAAARQIGYPVVLKPAGHAASIGVMRADNAEEVVQAYAFAAQAAGCSAESTQVLVEEYLDGPEVSVECVTHRGQTRAVAVTRKTLGPAPYFQEIAHSVDARDPLLVTVAPAATAAVQALGLTDGIQHVEIRLVRGRPRLVEVNARIGGDLIGHLVHRATGIDLPRAAADLACGRTPDLAPTRQQAAGIRMVYPPVSGTLTARHLDDEFRAGAPWLERVHWQRETGDEVVLPPQGGDTFTSRIGFLITTAPTAALAQQRAEKALCAVTVHIESSGQATSCSESAA
ncbi:ATP-grasp domain-containing protein [Streptomyces paromomycinus]|uniref:Carboxylase n=1 Tax=Streptomyces paromomycinus TaxID=92743 RepID=A0A401VXP0_STREY|nr:ATP-grasp domain-containing protein [Streptomyces paromomycinus]GCD41832.1 carboxylase [Streptomyces paromomycinus]